MLGRGWVAFHWLLIAAALGGCLARGLFQFTGFYDYWWYHLPSALRFLGIDNLEPEPFIRAMLEGYPPLAHATQALLIKVTGLYTASCAVNLLGLALVAGACRWLLGPALDLRWLLTMVLAIPAANLQLGRGYVDLWCGLALLLAFVSVLALYRGTERVTGAAALFAAGAGAAALSKFTTWPHVAVLFLFFAHALAKRRPSRRFLLGALAAAALTAGLWPARNVALYRNPTHPYHTAISRALGAPLDPALGNLQDDHFPTGEHTAGMSNPARFWYSALELSRFVPHEHAFKWSLDQSAQGAEKSPHYMLGGWFVVTFLTLVALALAGAKQRAVPLPALVLLAVMFAVVMPMQMSFAMRYWLVLPLALAAMAAISLAALPLPLQRAGKVVLVFAMIFVCDRTKTLRDFSRDRVETVAPEAAQRFWAENAAARGRAEPFVIVDQAPKTIFWTGPTFTEFRVREVTNRNVSD